MTALINTNKYNGLGDSGWWLRALPRLLISALLVAIATGCADPDELSPEQAAALEQRVRERWQTIIDRDFEKTWEYSTPNYRSVFSKRMFAKKFSYGIEWELTGVEVTHYDSRAAVASVAARVMTKPIKPTNAASQAIGATPLTLREKWILIDGEWWHSAKS